MYIYIYIYICIHNITAKVDALNVTTYHIHTTLSLFSAISNQ